VKRQSLQVTSSNSFDTHRLRDPARDQSSATYQKLANTPRESWDPNRQICFAAWLTSTGPMHLRSTNGYHLRSTSRFAPVIRTRTIARILSISAVRRPCVVRAFRMRSNPSDVRGPVLARPCILHFPQAIAGALQGMPVLVRAPHRGEA
jgi:hypothetical protein